jgi:hypothetical protein
MRKFNDDLGFHYCGSTGNRSIYNLRSPNTLRENRIATVLDLFIHFDTNILDAVRL